MTKKFTAIAMGFVIWCLPFFLLADISRAADYEQARLTMVRMQIVARGVRD